MGLLEFNNYIYIFIFITNYNIVILKTLVKNIKKQYFVISNYR